MEFYNTQKRFAHVSLDLILFRIFKQTKDLNRLKDEPPFRSWMAVCSFLHSIENIFPVVSAPFRSLPLRNVSVMFQFLRMFQFSSLLSTENETLLDKCENLESR